MVSRKAFVESHGATCSNWTWSWSFVNHEERFVIFGAWDTEDDGSKVMILAEEWATLRDRKQPGYPQSREHIRLVEEEGYRLFTFPMQQSGRIHATDTCDGYMDIHSLKTKVNLPCVAGS